MEPISKACVDALRQQEPRRICFATTHKNALRRNPNNPNFCGTFNLPFSKGFEFIFPYDLFYVRNKSPSVWRSIKTEEEYKIIEQWIVQQGERVFIRDCLSCSMALSFNFTDGNFEGERTLIGHLEYLAKNNRDIHSAEKLATYCINTINELEAYKKACYICAVPPIGEKPFDLPSFVVDRVSQAMGKSNITPYFQFKNQKQQNKASTVDEKWHNWENVGLSLPNIDLSQQDIILIDDKYQSGITMQYIAMKLQQAGAKNIFGLSMVKTMRDDDNQ